MKPENELILHPEKPGNIYTPLILRINKPDDKETYEKLLFHKAALFVSDEIEGQLRELIKSQRPSVRIKPDEYQGLIAAHLNGTLINEYGIWAYYPWSRR